MQFFFVPELGVELNEHQMREFRRTGVSPLPSLTKATEESKRVLVAEVPVVEIPVVEIPVVETPIKRSYNKKK